MSLFVMEEKFWRKKMKLNESRRQELGRASKGEIDVPMAFGL